MKRLVKRTRHGWFYRVGSDRPWIGPFVTEHVAYCVRDRVTLQPWKVKP